MTDTFQCWVCQSKNTPCSYQTFRKENYPNCEAARKSLGFGIFKTALECQNFCTTSTKPIDLVPVCWLCQGDGQCQHFLAKGQECPTGRNIFLSKADCEATCIAITPLDPPIQPIGPVPVIPIVPIPPIQPLVPPMQPIGPVPIQPIGPVPLIPIKPAKDDSVFWYVVITAVVLMLLALLIGGLILFV